MRKIILIAAVVLASASAQAAGPRSLSLAAANDSSTTQQTTPATTTATTQMSEAAPVTEAPEICRSSAGGLDHCACCGDHDHDDFSARNDDPNLPRRPRRRRDKPGHKALLDRRAASSASCIATASIGNRPLAFFKTTMAGQKPGPRRAIDTSDLIQAYCETVCTTLETGRALWVGTFSSFSSASSYSGTDWKVVLALICTIL